MSVTTARDVDLRPNRPAAKLTAAAVAAVTVVFVAARHSGNITTGHYFDYLHWTIAYAVAVTRAWSAVRSAQKVGLAARRSFARGLTLPLAAQLISELQNITHRIPIPNLSDALFLSIGPCFILGLLSPIRDR